MTKSTNPRYASGAITLNEANQGLEAQGFTGQFAAVEDGEVICFTCHQKSPSVAVELSALQRTEGASDPDDMVAVAAVICPNCNARGTLIMKYGADSSIEDSVVLRQLEDHRSTSSGGTASNRQTAD